MQVGDRVSKLRSAHSESLREAAARTGVSHTTIARIENGEVTGSFHNTLGKIAGGYGVSLEWLLTGREVRMDQDAMLQMQMITSEVSAYIAAIRSAIRMGIAPSDMDWVLHLGQKAMRSGVRRETIDLAIDLLALRRSS